MSGGPQLPLFGRTEQSERLKRVYLLAALEVVDRVGRKVVAPEVEMSPNNLGLALHEQERHALSFSDAWMIWTFDEAGTIIGALADHLGYFPPAKRPALTDTERLERLYKSLAKAGPAGAAILADALGGNPA